MRSELGSRESLADLAASVHAELVANRSAMSRRQPAPDEIARLVRAQAPLLDAERVQAVVGDVVARMGGLGPLEPLLADPDVSEVMVNGAGPVWVEIGGRLLATEVVVDRSTLGHLVERVVGPLGLRADRTTPLVDARLADGSRVNVVVPPLAVDGPYLTIRRFRARPVHLAELCPPGVAELLAWAVRRRRNIVISGGTGAGKTTLLNALAAVIPGDERIITVEDAAELRLPHRHVVRLESRCANADGTGGIAIRALVRNALRMRPDRIVVGECRGAEALDMLQAMNSGHEGSLTTCHANSPGDALARLETMVLMGEVALPLIAVRDQLRSAIDLVVQIARQASGERRVVAVAEVGPGQGEGSGRQAEALVHAGIGLVPLADEGGLRALPSRSLRSNPSEPPDPRWLVG